MFLSMYDKKTDSQNKTEIFYYICAYLEHKYQVSFISINIKWPIIFNFKITKLFIHAGVVATLAEPYGCDKRACNRKYRPVCGERVVNGKVEKKKFGNYCMMEAANDCGEGMESCLH